MSARCKLLAEFTCSLKKKIEMKKIIKFLNSFNLFPVLKYCLHAFSERLIVMQVRIVKKVFKENLVKRIEGYFIVFPLCLFLGYRELTSLISEKEHGQSETKWFKK
jgi:hypothetical protein